MPQPPDILRQSYQQLIASTLPPSSASKRHCSPSLHFWTWYSRQQNKVTSVKLHKGIVDYSKNIQWNCFFFLNFFIVLFVIVVVPCLKLSSPLLMHNFFFFFEKEGLLEDQRQWCQSVMVEICESNVAINYHFWTATATTMTFITIRKENENTLRCKSSKRCYWKIQNSHQWL